MSFGYVYKFTHPRTNKIYVGKREKSKFDTSYRGSGRDWKKAIEGIPTNELICEVLGWYDSRKSLNEAEVSWIEKLNATNPDVGYNVHKGGQGGNSLGDTEAWSALHKGEKNGRYGKPCPQNVIDAVKLANTGRKHSDEVNKSKGRPGVKKPDGFGDKVSKRLKGVPKSNDHKAKLSASLTGKYIGKHIYTNGEIEIRLYDNEPIPEGFHKGRKIKGKPTGKNNLAGKKWYNNGIEQKYFLEGTQPEGWVRGRLKKSKEVI